MSDLKYGDLVCYTNVEEDFHETYPIMYIGPCAHHPQHDWGCIDIWDMTGRRSFTDVIDHKAITCWQKCDHFK